MILAVLVIVAAMSGFGQSRESAKAGSSARVASMPHSDTAGEPDRSNSVGNPPSNQPVRPDPFCVRFPFRCWRGFFPFWCWAFATYYPWGPDDAANDAAPAQPPGEASGQDRSPSLEQQLRNDLEAGIPPCIATLASVAGRTKSNQPPATVLVFRDGRRVEVQSYAIVGDTLLVLGPQQSANIQLSQLDISASITANENRGVQFLVPIPPPDEP